MFLEIKLDLKITARKGDRPRRQSARADVQRNVPPMVKPRVHRQADLADDLAIKVQRIFGRPPRRQRDIWERFVVHSWERRRPRLQRRGFCGVKRWGPGLMDHHQWFAFQARAREGACVPGESHAAAFATYCLMSSSFSGSRRYWSSGASSTKLGQPISGFQL